MILFHYFLQRFTHISRFFRKLKKIMVKGPGLYSDIGKQARDLLKNDYVNGVKFSITTENTTGVEFTSTATKTGASELAAVSYKLRTKNITTDLKMGLTNLFTTIIVDEPAPGLKTVFQFNYPDRKSGQVELQYQHEYAGITTCFELKPRPLIIFSSVFGNSLVSLGSNVIFDTASGNFTKYRAALNVTHADRIASLAVKGKGDILKASYYQIVSRLTNTAVVAEFSHGFSRNENLLSIGTQHALNPTTMVKARVNNGQASALIQHDWNPRTRFSVVGEAFTGGNEKSARIGLAMDFIV